MKRPLRRFRNWLTPELAVPHVAQAAEPPVEPVSELSTLRSLDHLFGAPALTGYCRAGITVLTTPLGEFEIPRNSTASVLDVQHAVAWIYGLPELEPDSRRA